MDYTIILCIFNIFLFVIDKTFNTFTIQIKHWQNSCNRVPLLHQEIILVCKQTAVLVNFFFKLENSADETCNRFCVSTSRNYAFGENHFFRSLGVL